MSKANSIKLALVGFIISTPVISQEYFVSDRFVQTNVFSYAFDIDSLQNIQIACEEQEEFAFSPITYSVLDTNLDTLSQGLNVSSSGTNKFPAISVGPEGTAIFWTWRVLGDASGQAGVVIHDYQTAPDQTTDYTSALHSSAPALLSLNDSTWVHAWSRRLTPISDPVHDGVAVGRVLDIEGNAGDYQLIQNPEEHMATGRTAIATNSAESPIVLSWNDGVTEDMELYFSFIYEQGSPPSEPVRVRQDTLTRYILDHDVTVLESGEFIITWVEYPDDSESELYYQLFTQEGEHLGEPVRLDAPGVLTYNPRISSNIQDIAVVVWNEFENGTAGIFAQRIDAAGEKNGGVFRVTEDRDVQFRLHPMVELDGDRMVTMWLENFNDLWCNVIDINNPPVSTVHGKKSLEPSSLGLIKAYPSPFNGEVNLEFSLKEASNIVFSVYDLRGRKVLINNYDCFASGSHVIRWDGKDQHMHNLPSGVYVLEVKADHEVRSCMVVLIR